MSSHQDFGPLARVAAAPEQRVVGGVARPFVLSGDRCTTLQDAVQFVERYRASIDAALAEHGAVLFRGFPLCSAEDFDAFVCGFHGWEDLSYEESMSFAVRERRSNRICTTNEGKSGGLVFHHEQAQTPLWPSRVFFCCEKPAALGEGGATGLTPSDLVLKELRTRHPEFVAKCEREGVRYTIYAGPTQDKSKGAGRSWKSFFHAANREECEQKMRDGGWDWEWGAGPPGSGPLGPEFLKCTTPRLDAIKTAPGTTKRCFFNQLIATLANALEFSRVGQSHEGAGYDPLRDTPTQAGIDACVRFGDGTSVDLAVLLEAKAICEANAINVEWQAGDVALICNYSMMHARRPWKGAPGTRRVLASLVAEPDCSPQGAWQKHSRL